MAFLSSPAAIVTLCSIDYRHYLLIQPCKFSIIRWQSPLHCASPIITGDCSAQQEAGCKNVRGKRLAGRAQR